MWEMHLLTKGERQKKCRKCGHTRDTGTGGRGHRRGCLRKELRGHRRRWLLKEAPWKGIGRVHLAGEGIFDFDVVHATACAE
jgi:hypothetical protein